MSPMRSLFTAVYICAIFLLLSARSVLADDMPGQFSDELTTDHYNCLFTVEYQKASPPTQTVCIKLEAGDGKSETVLDITRRRLRLTSTVHGDSHLLDATPLTLTAGKPLAFTILRRGSSLGILLNGAFICHDTVPVGGGKLAAITAGRGWTVTASSIQRLETVVFADDFMRTADDTETARGQWNLVSGQWALQSAWDHLPGGNANRFASTIFAQNPFAWIGVGKTNAPAVCTTGKNIWEDYTVSGSVYPSAHGAVGLLVDMDMADAKVADNGLLVRWSSAHDAGQDGNQLTLYQLVNGVRTVLAKSPGGSLPGQWYRIAVTTSFNGILVTIDNTARIHYLKTAWRSGGIGLYVEGAEGTVFDHITTYGQAYDDDLLQEIQQTANSDKLKKFENDPNGMKEWAVSPNDWQQEQFMPGLRWYSTELYGDHNWIYMTTMMNKMSWASSTTPVAGATGGLTLLLNGDRTNLKPTGYRAVITVSGSPARQTYSIYRGTVLLATKTVTPLAPDTEYEFRFSQQGTGLRLEVDDNPVLQASDQHPLIRGSVAYQLDGQAFQPPRDVHAMSRNALDYEFSAAPADWWAIGTWMPSMRWSCTPEWSFLGGWSRGDAILWHKARFTGDQTLEAFMGIKMEYPREHDSYYTRYHGYLATTICGDGIDPRDGYCGIYGAPDADGKPYQRAVIMRNGAIVASTPINFNRSWGENHHHWFKLTLEKHGNTISFSAKLDTEIYRLSYPDPHPIDGGIPAIWTRENAISLARVRINCEHSPTPWAGPQVMIDTPWYPEWANIGQSQKLAFAESWSATGKPVTLTVTPREVPAGDEHAVIARGTQATFTPSLPGAHWYQITAGDGQQSSQAFHLDQLVFNPALGRDDSHALLLYRFDEGAGTVAHDSSTGPSTGQAHADLTVPSDPANARWVAGQGLTLRGPTPLIATANLDKLLTISQTKGCTIEFWVSTDTIFPPSTPINWCSTLFRLGSSTAGSAPYLAISQYTSTVKIGTMSAPAGIELGWGFTTSLHHYVITWDAQANIWDGELVHFYDNGTQVAQKTFAWQTNLWQKQCQLTLGQSYLGTYYLVAVHDSCFTADEVKRHYLAGPSAK